MTHPSPRNVGELMDILAAYDRSLPLAGCRPDTWRAPVNGYMPRIDVFFSPADTEVRGDVDELCIAIK